MIFTISFRGQYEEHDEEDGHGTHNCSNNFFNQTKEIGQSNIW